MEWIDPGGKSKMGIVKWQQVSGSDPTSPCTLCGELTQNHFWGSFKEGKEDFAMAYFFCGEDCLDKLRKVLGGRVEETPPNT